MFDDLIEKNSKKKKKKTINLLSRSSRIQVSKEFLEDVQEIIWNLEKHPCRYCGADLGDIHSDTCKILVVLEEIRYQLEKFYVKDN